jgi:uncharacterized protein
MKSVIQSFALLFLLALIGTSCKINPVAKLNVMVVAGGHSYDTLEFVEMFSSFSEFRIDTVMQPKANRLIGSNAVDDYDVIVFYDMWNDTDSTEKAGYFRLLDRGIGMVFLHHSLAGNQQWDEFSRIIGGKYHTHRSNVDSSRYSTFRHDIEIRMKIPRRDHPVTRNMEDFTILDEGYGNIEVKDDVMVILEADHAECSEYAGWVNTYGNSRIVYLMPGHDKHAYANENYRTLLKNSIRFVYRQGQYN